MARFDSSNILSTNKGGGHMYSMVGKATTGANVDEQVQCGMVGKIGEQILDNVYEFLPLADGDKIEDVVIATMPEVQYDESDITKSAIHNYVVETGAVIDGLTIKKGDKGAISLDGLEGTGLDAIAQGEYIYATGTKRKLQYKKTAPVDATDKPIFVARVESVYNATLGGAIGLGGTALALNYKMVKFRIIK